MLRGFRRRSSFQSEDGEWGGPPAWALLYSLELDPSFSNARLCAAFGLPTALAEPLVHAWSAAGLPPSRDGHRDHASALRGPERRTMSSMSQRRMPMSHSS